MPPMLPVPLFLAALLLVALMGAAIQRGATCMVIAVRELVTRRRARFLAAILVAGLWVGTILWVVDRLGLPVPDARVPAIGWWTLVGGILLGSGAAINGACVFGAVGRLGTGEFVFALTPVGFFLASLLMAGFPGLVPAPLPSGGAAVTPRVLMVVALAAVLAGALWKLAKPHRLARRHRLRRALTSPSSATASIGIAFAVLMLSAGHWTWPEAVAEFAAHPGVPEAGQRGLLFLALLGGAVLAAHRQGRWQPVAPSGRQAIRCLVGGAVLAVGSRLIPGSNDGLVLHDAPMAMPHALVALGAMVATLALIEVIAGSPAAGRADAAPARR